MSSDKISPELGQAMDELNLALGREMIALAGAFQPEYWDGMPSGKPQHFCFPGIVLDIRGAWLFVTAGHNLRNLKGAYRDRENNWTGMAWCQFIPEAAAKRALSVDNTVPRRVDFECDVVEREDCSVASGTQDWGILELTEPEKRWLAESGFRPFNLEMLKERYGTDGYIIMGLPVDLFDKMNIGATGASMEVDPTIIGFRRRDDLMAQAKKLWLIGDLPDEMEISLKGMSGGPLFAIRFNPPHLQIAGIQSHWCPTRRLSFVCPIETILNKLP